MRGLWLWWSAVAACLGVAVVLLYLGLGSPRIELGNLADWLAAIGALVAAVSALYIATRDRRDRSRELLAVEEAQARLVQIEVDERYRAVRIHNYGSFAILDVHIVSAYWTQVPDVRLLDGIDDLVILPVVKPDREALSGGTIHMAFVDGEGNEYPELLAIDDYGQSNYAEPPGGIAVIIGFTDANGNRWQTGNLWGLERVR